MGIQIVDVFKTYHMGAIEVTALSGVTVEIADGELVAIMEAYKEREPHTRAIDDAEHAADRITAETIRLLHKTLIPPLDSNHIHRLVTAMDDVCDLIQDVAESLTLFDIQRITPEISQLAQIAARCCERVKDVVGLLAIAEGSEAIFRTCEEIDQLESDADRVLRAAMSRLFRDEQDVREIIKLKAIYEMLEAITDRCEDVANIAEGIALENS